MRSDSKESQVKEWGERTRKGSQIKDEFMSWLPLWATKLNQAEDHLRG